MQLSMTPPAHLEPEYTIRPHGATRPETGLSASEPGLDWVTSVILTVLGSDHRVNPVEQGLSGQYLECSSSIHPVRDAE